MTPSPVVCDWCDQQVETANTYYDPERQRQMLMCAHCTDEVEPTDA